MREPRNKKSEEANIVMESSLPVGITSNYHDDNTWDNDVFDGIEDIYVDLEAVPPLPPPSSTDDILETQRLNSSLSSSKSSTTSASDQNVSNDASLEYQRETPYLCGIHSTKTPPRLRSIWNILGFQNYFEMEEEKDNGAQGMPPPKERAIDNGVEKVERAKVKKTMIEENDLSDTVAARDTIIRHTIPDEVEKELQPETAHELVLDIVWYHKLFGVSKDSQGSNTASALGNTVERPYDEDDTREKKTYNLYSVFLQKLRQTNLFGGSDENDESTTVDARNSSNQRGNDKVIMKEKLKKYYPSFWDILGQRKIFGFSYRLILLVMVNFFAFVLLIILIARFTRRNTTESDSLVDRNSTTSINVTSIEDESGSASVENGVENGDDVSSELLSLCDEEGVTVEDGVILTTNQVFEKGKYFCSPSKSYIIGMMEDFAIVDIRANKVVWSAGITDGTRSILQADGNLVIENEEGEIVWNTEAIPRSVGDYDYQLVFWGDNEAVIAIQQLPRMSLNKSPSNFWMDGVPEIQCNDCQTTDLEFPVRGTFYFPTFDNTERAWQDRNGNPPMHYPNLGFYSSSDADVITAHVEAMEYGKIDLAISSWQGPGTNYDRSRITMLLEETRKQDAGLKWTISYEAERLGFRSPEEIQSDLLYLRTWFTWQNSWAHVDGKPVIYVNNDGGCNVPERWMTGVAIDWFVVLRMFPGYQRCEYQPDSWYDQRINDANDGIDFQEELYYNLAPGQWRMGRPRPDLRRLSPGEWCEHVQDMVESNNLWQLIISFNDAYLGTSIEPSLDWRSSSNYGFYLDCLHDPQMF